MVRVDLWQDQENKVSFFDSDFDSLTDTFTLSLGHDQSCSRYVLDVTKVEFCKGTVYFFVTLNCSIPTGYYCLTIHNVSTDLEVIKTKCCIS